MSTAGPWPQLSPELVREDAVLFVLEQAETALKAQLDNADKQIAKLSSLLTASVSLGAAAFSVFLALVGLLGKADGAAVSEPWVFAPGVLSAAAIWLFGAFRAASVLQGVALAGPGKSPRDLYAPEFLGADRRALALYMLRVTGTAFEENTEPVAKIVRSVKSVTICLRYAPIPGAAHLLSATLLPL